MNIQEMFGTAVSLLENIELIKTIEFPSTSESVRASIKYKEDLGNNFKGTLATDAKLLIELQELEGKSVEIRYNTVIEIDGETWKVVRIEEKNTVFMRVSIRNDSRIVKK